MRYETQDHKGGHLESTSPRGLTLRLLQGLVTASAFALIAMPGAIVNPAKAASHSPLPDKTPTKEQKPAKKPPSVEREAELRRRESPDDGLPVQVSPETESVTHNPHVVAKAPEYKDAEFYTSVLGAHLRAQIDPDISRSL